TSLVRLSGVRAHSEGRIRRPFHSRPQLQDVSGPSLIALADTFNNESVIDRPVFAVLGDSLVGLVVIPILCSFNVREFRNDDSLNRITFKDFVLSIGYEHFDGMPLYRCLDSSPIFFELFLIDGFSSHEYNVCRHDRSPALLIDYRSQSFGPL